MNRKLDLASERGNGFIGIFMLTAIIVAIVGGAIFLTLAWRNGFGPWAAEIDRQINKESQQYQDATLTRLRVLVTGIANGSSDQKELFTNQFCALFPEVDEPSADIISAYEDLCF